eukprot:gnl/MRDRNA2_/MRDRNA2_97386_c0_seq1.p1 gnl/MRDRNA2_/MRDRNA2_97386_c0~~gnl/MRDRNA2_/MRDRNA2_97386_c0_seq1.p1  ORF type:complete len:286 (-),score=38.94 gnl/MRDRNA2_/MRDRNA2_97386_c0_seq1:81-938(-)
MPSQDHVSEIYVGNLSFEAEKEDLEDVFKTFGRVTDARIVTEKGSRKSKGFGFVRFDLVDDAEAAIREGAEFRGRKLVLKWARAKEKSDVAHLSPRRSRSRRRSPSLHRSRDRRSSGSDRSIERPRKDYDKPTGKAQLSARRSPSPLPPPPEHANSRYQQHSQSAGRSQSPSIPRPKAGADRRSQYSEDVVDRRREKERTHKASTQTAIVRRPPSPFYDDTDRQRTMDLENELAKRRREKEEVQQELEDVAKAARLLLQCNENSAVALEDLKDVLDKIGASVAVS